MAVHVVVPARARLEWQLSAVLYVLFTPGTVTACTELPLSVASVLAVAVLTCTVCTRDAILMMRTLTCVRRRRRSDAQKATHTRGLLRGLLGMRMP